MSSSFVTDVAKSSFVSVALSSAPSATRLASTAVSTAELALFFASSATVAIAVTCLTARVADSEAVPAICCAFSALPCAS